MDRGVLVQLGAAIDPTMAAIPARIAHRLIQIETLADPRYIRPALTSNRRLTPTNVNNIDRRH